MKYSKSICAYNLGIKKFQNYLGGGGGGKGKFGDCINQRVSFGNCDVQYMFSYQGQGNVEIRKVPSEA